MNDLLQHPGVAGLAQLGRNAIDRVAELERELAAAVAERDHFGVLAADRQAELAKLRTRLAELERAAKEPCLYMAQPIAGDYAGYSHPMVSYEPAKCVVNAADCYYAEFRAVPLYTAPPHGIQSSFNDTAVNGRAMIAAVLAELGPALGLVEIREPSDAECIAINERVLRAHGIEGCGAVFNGRTIFNAVRDVMWPKEGL